MIYFISVYHFIVRLWFRREPRRRTNSFKSHFQQMRDIYADRNTLKAYQVLHYVTPCNISLSVTFVSYDEDIQIYRKKF